MSNEKKQIPDTGVVSHIDSRQPDVATNRNFKAEDPIHQAFQAVNDSFIIYDRNGHVVTFSEQHVKYYPWLTGHLKVGAHFKDILTVAAYSGSVPELTGREEAWIKKRLENRPTDEYVEEMTLRDGRVTRLRESPLPDGGRVIVLTDVTAARKKEQAFAQREAEYRNLLEASPDAICITVKGRLIYVNGKMARLFGASSVEELEGNSGISIIHPDDIELITRYRAEHKDQLHEARPLEIRLKRLDGSFFYGDLTTGVVTWKGVKANLCTIRDITFRKNIIETLARREQDLKAAHNLATIGYWTFDTATHELTSSEELHKIANIDPEKGKLTFSNLQQMFPKGEFERLQAAILAGIKTKTPFDFEHEVYVDGKIRHAKGRGHAIYDETGWATKVFGVSQDITEQKRMERALRINEKRFRDLSEASADLYWETDENLNFVFISDSVERIIGLNPSDYVGRNVHTVFEEAQAASPALSNILDIMDRRESFRNISFPRWNPITKKTVWIRCSAIPYYNERGNFAGYRGSNTDITKEVELEEQLKQSQKMEAIGQLTGGIAHDFNNLLAIIQGNSELLQENLNLTESQDHLRKLDAIARAADRGADLTHRMLAYSRKQALNPSVQNLAERVREMAGIIERTLGAEYNIQISSDPDLAAVHVDGGQIDNTLLNLVLNARDAMPEGGDIRIRTENYTQQDDRLVGGSRFKAGEYVCLAVADTGGGIPAENLKHVFDPFFTTKEIGKGTGLGLSVVYGFVQQSNGVATIGSEPGKGTLVSLYFPVYKEPVAPDNR